jgi:hypothetical protein
MTRLLHDLFQIGATLSELAFTSQHLEGSSTNTKMTTAITAQELVIKDDDATAPVFTQDMVM